jgi:hypothetical protein
LLNEVLSRCSSPSDIINIRHLLYDNTVHETPPDTLDIQSLDYDRINLQASPVTTSQPQLAANIYLQISFSDRDLRFSINTISDYNKFRLSDYISDQSLSHDNSYLEGRIPSEIQDGAIRLLFVAAR